MAHAQNQKLTGRGVIVWLIATFGVVLAVNFYFIYQAERTYPGQDVSHPYLQGVDYNQTLDDRAKQAQLGWSAAIGGALAQDGTAAVAVTSLGKAGEAADRDTLKIAFGGHVVAEKGLRAAGYDEKTATKAVSGETVEIAVDLGIGKGKARVWTCDLTEGYIHINGSYRS